MGVTGHGGVSGLKFAEVGDMKTNIGRKMRSVWVRGVKVAEVGDEEDKQSENDEIIVDPQTEVCGI